MNKRCVRHEELFDSVPTYLEELFAGVEYPWEILPRIRAYGEELILHGMTGYRLLGEGVLVGEGVRIAPTAFIEGPTVLGAGCEVRHGAFLRGGVITGEGCVIGNSSEVKNSILLNRVQIPHYNYVGDSVLGNRVHLGAGSICSNLKADGRDVVVHGERDYVTGLRKLGGILGDGADIGCGAVINPGTVIGKNTSVYPLIALRGVYPADCIIKATDTVVKRRHP